MNIIEYLIAPLCNCGDSESYRRTSSSRRANLIRYWSHVATAHITEIPQFFFPA
jgi:hypothetical protein